MTELRGSESQQKFAEKLKINRSSLSLLETGKQIPSLDILNRVCNLGSFEPSSYFTETNNDALIYLMGKLEESDREKVDTVMDRIRIKEKYSLLSKR
ncbi:MAG: helix-turn-helix domain-containing protein, partial [Lachnospiraceae bacterium]|nr:helix-turn-helix domain-containing protein [Lachnospiraceae bacterium]